MPVAPCASYVDGPCEKDMNSTNLFWFPVGKNQRANTCAITPQSSTAATFRTQYFDFKYVDITDIQAPLVAVSGVQYWYGDIVTPNPASTNAIIRLYWIPGDYGAANMPTPSNLVVARWDTLAPNPPGPTPAWVTAGVSNISPGATYNSGWIESAVVLATKYGTNTINRPFTLGTLTADNSLPVEMGPFTARQVDNHVQLDWQTYSEIESLGFELDRSRTGSDGPIVLGSFENDTALMAKSPSGAYYQTIDDSALTTGSYTYDLYQTDKDGIRTHAASQTLDFSEIAVPNALEVAVYPNPAVANTNVEFDLPSDENVRMDLYDVTGRIVKQVLNGDYSIGPHVAPMDLSNVPAGSYDLIVTAGNQRLIRGVVIQK